MKEERIRHLPVFGVFGAGDYRLQPIYVDDLAQAAVEKALGDGRETVEAIGPETFTYRQLVEEAAPHPCEDCGHGLVE